MKKILLTFFVFLFPLTLFANENEVIFSAETKTLKELKTDLVNIEKEEEKVKDEIDSFIKDSELKDYLKENLSAIEFKNLETIANTYTSEKTAIEQEAEDLENGNKSEKLLNLKLQLYKDLTQFIKVDKYALYLEYVGKDTQILKEQKDIEDKKTDTLEVMDKRVQVLEQKIEEHKNAFEKEMSILIEQKVEEKINIVFSSEKFLKLDYETKVQILSNTLLNIINKKTELQESLLSEENSLFVESIKQKIEVYEITTQKVKLFRENLIKNRGN